MAQAAAAPAVINAKSLPRLERSQSGVRLLLDERPLLLLAGELGNSSAAELEWLAPLWQRLVKLGLNTLLVPVYWELLEPEQGRFDFQLLDGILAQARAHGLKLVLLWFGSWKNSMSCYAPAWLKRDPARFPRAELRSGQRLEMLSAFSAENREADALAFARLMQRLNEVDAESRTVLMVQVENEVGMLVDARDHCPAARAAYAGPVPPPVLAALGLAEGAGARPDGSAASWSDVVGVDPAGDELFMAWYYASYVEAVAAAGKAVRALPMFVNAALNRPDKLPGEYPSAGPLPHLFEVWRAAAPSIDFLAPDIYYGSFTDWCARYARHDNPLFIPEISRGEECAVRVFHAFGEHAALGFSPFAIESISEPAGARLAQSYALIAQLAPSLLEPRPAGHVRGVLLDSDTPRQRLLMGELALTAVHDFTWEWSSRPAGSEPFPEASALLILLAPDELLVAGSGVIVSFAGSDSSREVGIEAIDEGIFVAGRWRLLRRLNGDETHQGRHLRIPYGSFGIQRVKLYRF